MGEQVVALERVSGLSAEDAKSMLLEAVRAEAEHDAVKLGRAIERAAREEAQDKARDIVVTAMQRVAAGAVDIVDERRPLIEEGTHTFQVAALGGALFDREMKLHRSQLTPRTATPAR